MDYVNFSLLLGSLLSLLVCYSYQEDPCTSHIVLSDPWRNLGFYSGYVLGLFQCDAHLAGQWVRFTGVGGDVLPEFCVPPYYCGSPTCAYMAFTHPKLGEGIKQGDAEYATKYIAQNGKCFTKSITGIQALACNGGYFVYSLPQLLCPATFAVRHSVCTPTSCGPLSVCYGSGYCSCMSGYVMPTSFLPTNGSFSCLDIDECLDTTICGSYASCNNTVGSYVCTCYQGFRFTHNGTMASINNPCYDIDECMEDSTVCGPNATCTNTLGSFICTCYLGYHVDSGIPSMPNPCQDIDECVADPTICGPSATCTNTLGNYMCTCHEGYLVAYSGYIASISNPCREFALCVGDPIICGPNADCTSITETFQTCICYEGYQVTPTFTMPSQLNPCEDVDECLDAECGLNALCANTLGSHYCYCPDGYIPSAGILEFSGNDSCISLEEHLDSLTPPEGQMPEVFFLTELLQNLEDNNNISLSEKAATGIMNGTLSIMDKFPEEGMEDSAEAATIILKIIEKLTSSMVESTDAYSNITIKKPTMVINKVSMRPGAKVTQAIELKAKGNKMEINLKDIAQNNNGYATSVLMSISGMEKLMSPRIVSSDNATELYSDIISATLPSTSNRELADPVNFTIIHKKLCPCLGPDQYKISGGPVKCVYWDEKGKEKNWSVEGCTTTFSNGIHTVCSCTHLSTFALLLQIDDSGGTEDDTMLEIINLVLMAVGLAFLALAILTFLLCKWNPKINNTARLHLCICLFLAHLLFLVGVSRTENPVMCAVIAGILHFLFLSSFIWMLLETLQLFLLVRSLSKVQVIQKEGLKAMYLLLIGYGIPLVVVGVSAGVFSDGYGSSEACWLGKEKNFHWSFIGPVCAVLTLNLISFCVIVWSLQPTLANMKSDISQSKDTRLIIFKIVAQFLILGCAWVVGFFQNTVLLKYIFIILNSQQGTFIFIVHCLLNKEVREEYKRWFCLSNSDS